ncbi:MAG TPA: YraN family protein [Saprospiraceae bacterium]|nr:YraN family protein [Saprospiraceae bacterium]
MDIKNPRNNHLITGEKGEKLAVEYLLKKGYEIMEVNWRYSRAEIDIIAKDNSTLVFVEVKSGQENVFTTPEIAVNEKKKMLILDAASQYMKSINYEWEIRFDIVSVVFYNKNQYEIIHYEDAFFN